VPLRTRQVEERMSEAIADIRLDALIWMFARLEFFRPTESRPIMLTKAKEKIPIANATSVRVNPPSRDRTREGNRSPRGANPGVGRERPGPVNEIHSCAMAPVVNCLTS
jgi:hypothetical protein